MQLKLHAVAAGATINNCVVFAIKDHLQHKCEASKEDKTGSQ
jgi:hypothetical protein